MFRPREGEDEVRDIGKHDFRSVLLYFSFNANQAKQRVTLKYARTTGYSDNHSDDGLTRFQTARCQVLQPIEIKPILTNITP